MTKRQKLTIEASEKRQRLNELLALDELTDEQRAELETLSKRMQQIEVEMRAAVTAEAADEAEARGLFGNNGDGEPAETRRLLETVTLGDYLAPAGAGAAIEGRARELNEALQSPLSGPGGGVAVPWEVLLTPELRRAPEQDGTERRAFTDTGDYAGGIGQRPILQRLFGPGIADALGVRIDSVPVGRTEWPLITAGVAPAMAVEGAAAAAAVAPTFATETLKPKRLTGRYEYTHEMAGQVMELEQALRRDLADAVRSQMSNLLINGDEATNAHEPDGFATTIAAPADAGATATYADYAGAHAQAVDGIHAGMETQVSSVIGVSVYQHAAAVYQTGSGESGSEALRRRSMSCMASPYVGDASNAGQQKLNLFHAAGPNGGGVMRGDSVAAMWPTLEVIRDIYSKASQGVVLTWVTLWDAQTAFRSSAYKRVAFDIS